MARPATHADLSDYDRQGDQLFSWSYLLPEHPEVEQFIVKAKLEAKRLGLVITRDDVKVPKSVEALDSALAAIQSRWDNGEAQYVAVRDGHCSYADLSWSDKNAAEFYAKCEELPKIEDARDAELSRLLGEAPVS